MFIVTVLLTYCTAKKRALLYFTCSIENFMEDFPSKCVPVYEGCQQCRHIGDVPKVSGKRNS